MLAASFYPMVPDTANLLVVDRIEESLQDM